MMLCICMMIRILCRSIKTAYITHTTMLDSTACKLKSSVHMSMFVVQYLKMRLFTTFSCTELTLRDKGKQMQVQFFFLFLAEASL